MLTTRATLIFLSFMVSFLVDMFNQEAPFLTKKASSVKSETQFRREVYPSKALFNKIPSLAEVGALQSCS